MKAWLERVAFLQILNSDSATKFDAGGRSAQTFPFVRFLGNVRTAHLQRHLSAKYIEQSRCVNEYEYSTQPTTKLPKIVTLRFLIFL